MAEITRFPSKPDPEPEPPPAKLAPIPKAPKDATITYRASEVHERLLTRAAGHLGVSRSRLINSLVAQFLDRITKKQDKRESPHPFLDLIDELRREADRAMADGAIDVVERARLTELISDQLHWLWRRAA